MSLQLSFLFLFGIDLYGKKANIFHVFNQHCNQIEKKQLPLWPEKLIATCQSQLFFYKIFLSTFKMKKVIKSKCYVPPCCTFIQMENSCCLCDASNRLNSTETKEEEWQPGGVIIDETIEV